MDTATRHGFALSEDLVPHFVRETYLTADVFFSRSFGPPEVKDLSTIVEAFSHQFEELQHSKELLPFLCHASEDKRFVESLGRFLDAQNVPVWYDRREIQVGDSIVHRVSEGLASASHVVVVLSRTSVQKNWVQRELASSLMRQLANASVKLLPVLLDDCELPTLLSDIKYADCRQDSQHGFADLLAAIL
jgi:hypothetical protein